MSDTKNRLSPLTAGSANLVVGPGDLITGDGEQAIRFLNPNVGGASDGKALVLDSTQPSGLNWSPTVGVVGLVNVTGSDGVSVTTPMVGIRNATNDLVTGTPVAQVDAVSSGTVDITGADTTTLTGPDGNFFRIEAGGDVDILATGGAGGLNLTSRFDTNVKSNAGNIKLQGNSGGASAISLDSTNGGFIASNNSGSRYTIAPDGTISISASSSKDIDLSTGGTGDINVTPNHDETHTVGRNFNVTASGSGGINLTSDGGPVALNSDQGNVNIRSGVVSGAGSINLTSKGSNDGIVLTSSLGGSISGESDANIDLTSGLGGAGTGFIHIESPGGTGSELRLRSDTAAAEIKMSGSGGDAHKIKITSNGTGANGTIDLTATSTITVTTSGTGDLLVNPNHDETHTVGRNFSVDAAGSGGITLTAETGNAVLDAGSVDHTGEVRLQPRGSAPAAGETFRIWNGAGASQQNGAIGASGGTVVDAELRTAFNTLLTYLYGWGWVTNPTP